MANYYTQFSCIFDVGSAENSARAADIRRELETEMEEKDADLGFSMEQDLDTSLGALWIYSDECGEPEHVIKFVLRCAETMNLTGVWGFTWALSCSRPRLDSYGGGAQVLDLGKRETIEWIDCSNWVSERTQPEAACCDTSAVASVPGTGSETETALDFMTGEEGAS